MNEHALLRPAAPCLAELAQLLDISPRTADPLRASARGWLHQQIQEAVFALDAV